MKITNVLLFGAVVTGAVLLDRRRRAQPSRPLPAQPDDDLTDQFDEEQTSPAIATGIADVDPQPLTQISGEGIDPDATLEAHDSVIDQRARLAQPGENLP